MASGPDTFPLTAGASRLFHPETTTSWAGTVSIQGGGLPPQWKLSENALSDICLEVCLS